MLEDSYKDDGGNMRRADGMYGSGLLHSHEFGGGGSDVPIRQPPTVLRRRSSRANMLLAAHPVSDPILDITLGSTHGSSMNDDDDDHIVAAFLGNYCQAATR